MNIRKYIISIASAIFIMAVFVGCAPKYIDVNEGKSVIVVPIYYLQGLRMYWGKADSKKQYNYEKINSYYHTLRNSKYSTYDPRYDFLIDADYQVLAVDPGVYYVSQAYFSIPKWEYTLKLPLSSTNVQKFKSNIGNIWLKKRPKEREIITAKNKM
ncbi:MAG: hypothetical protein LBE13_14035 [Bacteroidales bacterium]|jgi:hypothetical protein|nr:hypothetical protein [Bacteroidales bacterium]